MDYKPNSHKYKEENKRQMSSVTKGTIKKKNDIDKFKDTFLAEDLGRVKDYILGEVIIPHLKKGISDIVSNTMEMLLYGEVKGSKKETSAKISYKSYYEDKESKNSSRSLEYNYDTIIIESRGEAERVLEEMGNILEAYNLVSVADFYELVGVNSKYTDNKYGWTNLSNAKIERTRDGYYIKLPRAKAID